MIGRVTVDGQFSSWQAGDLGIGLVLGPNGALWFTTDASDANAIGSITTGGGISYYAVDSSPWGIAVGPSGNDLWFPMYSTNQIGRLSTTGRTTAFDVPHRGPRMVRWESPRVLTTHFGLQSQTATISAASLRDSS